MNFNRVFHYKPSILGYLYFWKHPHFKVWMIITMVIRGSGLNLTLPLNHPGCCGRSTLWICKLVGCYWFSILEELLKWGLGWILGRCVVVLDKFYTVLSNLYNLEFLQSKYESNNQFDGVSTRFCFSLLMYELHVARFRWLCWPHHSTRCTFAWDTFHTPSWLGPLVWVMQCLWIAKTLRSIFS